MNIQEEVERFCSQKPGTFKDDADILHLASIMLQFRENTRDRTEADEKLAKLEKRMSRLFHRALKNTRGCCMAETVRASKLKRVEREILLVLTLGALGMIQRPYDIEDIQNRLGTSRRDNLDVIKHLSRDGRLARAKLVVITDADLPVDRGVWVSPDYLARLLPKSCGKKDRKAPYITKPKVKLSQMVLSEEVSNSLQIAISQAKHSGIMIDKWGLGKMIPYGRAITLLFSGTPGVGKTASAQAIAYELKRKILIANYSELESCWRGETEKNVSRVFADAAKANALLLWDEADSMFYSREEARSSWEVKTINVLLQELEKFEGVCILSTNRKMALDSALERRIALKITFPRPDKGMRSRIWEKILAGKMPVAEDVSPEVLSTHDLSGGEIKNVVMNAARLALKRSTRGPVTMEDLETAVRMEKDGSWCETHKEKIGFRR